MSCLCSQALRNRPLASKRVTQKDYKFANFSFSRSRIQFILSSNDDESDVRTLPQMTFHRSSVEGFVMTTTKPLGELSYLRIWHDNSGIGDYASWFLTTVIIKDMQV